MVIPGVLIKALFGYKLRLSVKPMKSEMRTIRLIHSSHIRNQAQVLNGRLLAKRIRDELKAEVERRLSAGYRPPHLTAVLVGDDPVSSTYIKVKEQAALYIGITSHTICLPKTCHEEDLIDQINKLNDSDTVDGILVQLPLPSHMNERRVCNTVNPLKDVDGFHFVNMGCFTLNMFGLAPCTALGVAELIRHSGIETKGKNAVVCGRSKNVGLPIAMILNSDSTDEMEGLNTTTTICHRFTPPEQLAKFTREADIIVSAAGVPGLIRADMVKEGVCVIDVGITRTPEGKAVGDVDYEGVSKKAGFITPVPGGVGPMTVAMLMRNTVQASRIGESMKNFNVEFPPP